MHDSTAVWRHLGRPAGGEGPSRFSAQVHRSSDASPASRGPIRPRSRQPARSLPTSSPSAAIFRRQDRARHRRSREGLVLYRRRVGPSAPAPAPARRARHRFRRGALHKFLAEITTPLLIVVTNYDTLLEQAFQRSRASRSIWSSTRRTAPDIGNSLLWWTNGKAEPEAVEPNELDLDRRAHDRDLQDARHRFGTPAERVGQLRHHRGGLHRVPLADDDHEHGRAGAVFYRYFRERSFLFLGYSLRDWNLRVVLQQSPARRVARAERPRRARTACRRGRSSGRPPRSNSELWGRRSVNIFDMDIDAVRRKQLGGDGSRMADARRPDFCPYVGLQPFTRRGSRVLLRAREGRARSSPPTCSPHR